MLKAAGLWVLTDRPEVDETAVKRDCRAGGQDAAGTASILAAAKANAVAPRHPGCVVVGGDQMLVCEGEWFDKPADRPAAARQIARLAGRTHSLISAAVAVRDGEMLWAATETAELTMRTLSADFIERYLGAIGDAALDSVGGYQIEGPGIQLFSAISGDHFTILGFPLIPLLGFLREQGVIPT
jgi:septum formation protein